MLATVTVDDERVADLITPQELERHLALTAEEGIALLLRSIVIGVDLACFSARPRKRQSKEESSEVVEAPTGK